MGIIFIIPYGEVTPIENNGEADKWYQITRRCVFRVWVCNLVYPPISISKFSSDLVLQHDGHEINRLIEGVTSGYTYPNAQVALLGLIVIGVIFPYGCVEECHTPYLANLIQFISSPQCSGT